MLVEKGEASMIEEDHSETVEDPIKIEEIEEIEARYWKEQGG